MTQYKIGQILSTIYEKRCANFPQSIALHWIDFGLSGAGKDNIGWRKMLLGYRGKLHSQAGKYEAALKDFSAAYDQTLEYGNLLGMAATLARHGGLKQALELLKSYPPDHGCLWEESGNNKELWLRCSDYYVYEYDVLRTSILKEMHKGTPDGLLKSRKISTR